MKTWLEQFEIIKNIVAKKFFAGDLSAVKPKVTEQLLGLSRTKWQKWERGQKPSSNDMAILVTKLGMSAHWLLTGEGPMFQGSAPESVEKKKKRIASDFDYPDDALGRIAMLTNIRTSSALELEAVFGASFKDIKPFLAHYEAARIKRAEWLAAGGDEEEMPVPLPALPDEWLHFFWTHFGPNPAWIQGGERFGSRTPLLRERPRNQSSQVQLEVGDCAGNLS